MYSFVKTTGLAHRAARRYQHQLSNIRWQATPTRLALVGLAAYVILGVFAILAIIGFGAPVQTRAGSTRGWDFSLNEVEY